MTNVYICTPCTHPCTGQVGIERFPFLGKDDRTLVIYIELFIYGPFTQSRSLISSTFVFNKILEFYVLLSKTITEFISL